MKKTILLLFFYLLASVSMAQRVAHDHDIQGYRYIDTYNTRVLTPKGSSFPISISLDYYQGFSNPFYIRLYSRYKLSETDELLITFSDGNEMHLFASTNNIMNSRLGILIKEVTIYDALYPLDEQQLNAVLSSPIISVKIGSGNNWHCKNYKSNKIGKWLQSNYKYICKRLEKS
jgi:hypothetical protein